jgi:beta-lactamase class D
MSRPAPFLFALLLLSACSPNNVTIDSSLAKFFSDNRVEGTFALMNNATGQFTVHNLERYRDSSFLPASTFTIVNSLVGLQEGIISSDTMTIPWDGMSRPYTECNKNLTMYEAFRLSCVSYFQEVARRTGKDTMQHWLDSLSYGSKRITSRIDTFWLDNSLKITPDEQLGLVKRLYFNQLPFFKLNQEIVKKALLFEDKPEYKLSYTTGLGHKENGHSLGWVLGYIEENGHVYFFVLNSESPDPNFDFANVQMKMLKDILSQLGFFKGNK